MNWKNGDTIYPTQKGIISGIMQSGTTILYPKGNATRAQAATMVMQYMK